MRVVLGFGLNDDGQCGVRRVGSSCPMSIIRFPLEKITILQLSAGSRHSLALSSTNMIFSWGWGLLGQLGLGNSMSIDTPTLIESLVTKKCVAISAGGMHSGAIDSKGQLYTWGSNGYGQLGIIPASIDEVAKKHPSLVTVHDCSDSIEFTKISCGGMHSAAIDSHSNVYCWGRADSGQIGSSNWFMERFSFPGIPYPTRLQGLDEPAIDIAAGGFYTLILSASGKVYAMGKDDFGLLGIPAKVTSMMTSVTSKPTLIEYFIKNSIKISSIAAGGWHSCFISDTGDLYTCGKGEYGRLGTGTGVSQDEPTKIQSHPQLVSNHDIHSQVKAISAGGSHTMWIDSHSDVLAVGRTCEGRLGLTNLLPKELDKGVTLARALHLHDNLMLSDASVIDVKCGGSHSLLLVEVADEHVGSDGEDS